MLRQLADVRFLVEAQDELWAAHEWYRERSPAAARHFILEIRRAVTRIAEAPQTWPVLRRGTRRYVVSRFPFSIVYRVDASGVLIISVAHSKRRYAYWRDRE